MEGWIGRLERTFRAVKLSCMIPQSWIHIIIPLSKPTECTTPRVSPCVNYGLGVIMTCQCRLINSNKRTPLVIMGKALHGWMQGDMGRESCPVVSDSSWPHRLYIPCNSPGQDTGVGSLSFLQGIFPTQESNQGRLHSRRILYQLSYQGVPQDRGKLYTFCSVLPPTENCTNNKVYIKVWGRGTPILQHTTLMLEHLIKRDLYIMLYIILHLSPKSSKVLNVPPSFILTTSSHLQWNINTVKLGRKRQYRENEAKSQDESLAEIDLQFNFPYWASRFFQTYKCHAESKQLGVSSMVYPEVYVCACVYT